MSSTPQRGGGGRIYYGWVLVAALAITETTSYGILSYAFPVFLAPMQAELGWSTAAMTGAFSLGMLVSGLAAIPAGRWVDRHGARALMAGGSIGATLLLLAWAVTDHLWAFYLTWLGLGLASAAVLYEPAFAVVANWFVRLRSRAITVLTFVAGFASVIFIPLATWLVAAHGWRMALVLLAIIYGALTILPHALLLRRRPEDVGLQPDGDSAVASHPTGWTAEVGVPAREALRSRSFRLIAITFGASTLVTTAVAVHAIPLLLERGHGAGFAAAVLGAVGMVALPGRLIITPLGNRWPRAMVTAAIFVAQGLGLVALLATGAGWGIWAFVALFGVGFGAITPARAAWLAEAYGRAEYGRINGTLALVLALARAVAPVGASLLHVALGGYVAVLWILIALSAVSAASCILAGDALHRPAPRLAGAAS